MGATRPSQVALMAFIPIYITKTYEDQMTTFDEAEREKLNAVAKDVTTTLQVTSNVLGIIFGIVIGKLLDLPKTHFLAFKLYKMIIFVLTIEVLSFLWIVFLIFGNFKNFD